jgi:nitrogen regulatory protein PII-like uncharacterized protein
MNAVDFVREFTVFGAKEYLAGATFYKDKLMVFTDIDDLKQIIDAFELVGSKGNLRLAHNFMQSEKFKSYSRDDRDNFEKAINLVEQCQK